LVCRAACRANLPPSIPDAQERIQRASHNNRSMSRAVNVLPF
jgi:hypothetical protein